MFMGRREDGSIYGLWAVRQWEGQEELPDDHAEVAAFRAAVPTPGAASAGDFMRALYELGWYDDVSAAVTAAGGLPKILWNRASVFERNHPMVIAIATAIGKTSDDLDELFRKATTYR
jgi:hypothetical protein